MTENTIYTGYATYTSFPLGKLIIKFPLGQRILGILSLIFRGELRILANKEELRKLLRRIK